MDKNPIIDQQIQDKELPPLRIPEEKRAEFINDILKETAKVLMTSFYLTDLKAGMNATVVNDTNGDKFVLTFTKIT